MKVDCIVPVRGGSERLPSKNFRALNGRPLPSYAVDIAKRSSVFSRIVLNADSRAFEDIARNSDCEFYLRPAALGASTVPIDEVVADFIRQFEPDVVAIVNPPSPLLLPAEVSAAVGLVAGGLFDSVIAAQNLWRHSLYDGEPVNFDTTDPLRRTQDLTPIEVLCYSVMVWRADIFLSAMSQTGAGLFCGRFTTLAVSDQSAIAIKTADDFRLVEALMSASRDTVGAL